MDHAHFERLGELVRELLPLAPELEVYSEATQCLGAEPGSTLILVPRAEDADWLNINRPLFSVRALRVVLFCTREVSVALLQGAVDFMDWLSLRVECPPGPVPFAVAGLRSALANRVPGIVWTGGDLETNFAATRPRHVLRSVNAARPYEELVAEARTLRPREWLAWTGVDGLFRLRRVRWAMAEARRRTRAILVEPTQSPSGWWKVHGRMMDFKEGREQLNKVGTRYPGRWAALLGLEPESIQLLENLPEREHHDASLQEAILEGVEPGLLVGYQAIAHGLVSKEDLLDGRAPIPARRAWAVFRGSTPLGSSREVESLEERLEKLLWQKPATGEAWRTVALDALSTGDPNVAELWARSAVEREHTNWSEMTSQSKLAAMQSLAAALKAQGRLEEARQQQEQILKMVFSTLGSEHPDTLIAMNDLASTLEAQGHFEEARQQQERVLEVSLRVLGPEHPNTLSAMNNLASTLRAQGQFEDARQQQERVLELSLRVLGPEHPSSLAAMNNLAAILEAQGQFEEARQQQERVLELSLRVLGPEHPDTLRAMNNLASTLQAQGQFEKARQQQERVLELSLRVLGPEHPSSLMAMNNLAAILEAQGRFEEARQQQERILAVSLRVLGPEHPSSLTAMNNLATTLRAQGRSEEARQHQERVLELSLRVLGPEHPDTLSAMNNLAATLGTQGRFEEACQQQERVLEVSLRVLGPEHPDTLRAMNNLAATLGAQGRFEEARQHQERVLEVRLRVLGPRHPNTLITMHNLAHTYEAQNKFEAAKNLEEKALDGALRTWGDAHPSTLNFMSSLAVMRRHLGDTTGAELLEKKVEQSRSHPKQTPSPPPVQSHARTRAR